MVRGAAAFGAMSPVWFLLLLTLPALAFPPLAALVTATVIAAVLAWAALRIVAPLDADERERPRPGLVARIPGGRVTLVAVAVVAAAYLALVLRAGG